MQQRAQFYLFTGLLAGNWGSSQYSEAQQVQLLQPLPTGLQPHTSPGGLQLDKVYFLLTHTSEDISTAEASTDWEVT